MKEHTVITKVCPDPLCCPACELHVRGMGAGARACTGRPWRRLRGRTRSISERPCPVPAISGASFPSVSVKVSRRLSASNATSFQRGAGEVRHLRRGHFTPHPDVPLLRARGLRALSPGWRLSEPSLEEACGPGMQQDLGAAAGTAGPPRGLCLGFWQLLLPEIQTQPTGPLLALIGRGRE